MSKIIIIVTKDDIVTTECGFNIEVDIGSNIILNFTTEAIEELIRDYEEIKKSIKE